MFTSSAAVLATLVFGSTSLESGGLLSTSSIPAWIPAAADTACPAQTNHMPVKGRKSPLDSLTFRINQASIKVCYGRPAARGRTMIGGTHVPYGKLWRTGANEPTVFFTPVAISMAGLAVPPGLYSLYTVPGTTSWEIVVNRSTSQWGHERAYTDAVKAQELGRATVASESIETPVESFTIRAEPNDAKPDAATLILEWERTRVRIPVTAQ